MNKLITGIAIGASAVFIVGMFKVDALERQNNELRAQIEYTEEVANKLARPECIEKKIYAIHSDDVLDFEYCYDKPIEELKR